MKTPREILLARHQAVVPKLDAIRQSTVAAVCDRRTETNNAEGRRPQTAAIVIWNVFWGELIWPSRRIWAGLAAVWVLILAANVSLRSSSLAVVAKSSPTPEMISSFRQQERILAELIGQTEIRAAVTPESFSPRPGSERRIGILMT